MTGQASSHSVPSTEDFSFLEGAADTKISESKGGSDHTECHKMNSWAAHCCRKSDVCNIFYFYWGVTTVP